MNSCLNNGYMFHLIYENKTLILQRALFLQFFFLVRNQQLNGFEYKLEITTKPLSNIISSMCRVLSVYGWIDKSSFLDASWSFSIAEDWNQGLNQSNKHHLPFHAECPIFQGIGGTFLKLSVQYLVVCFFFSTPFVNFHVLWLTRLFLNLTIFVQARGKTNKRNKSAPPPVTWNKKSWIGTSWHGLLSSFRSTKGGVVLISNSLHCSKSVFQDVV